MRTCSVPECSNPHNSHGLCGKHGMRLKRHGAVDKTVTPPKGLTANERLRWSGWTVTDTGCWEWNRTRDKQGYGGLLFDGSNIKAHRLAYETWVGPIPDGHVVRHKCDNPPCINPEHLETGTQSDNMRDMVSRGRQSPLRGSANPASRLTEQDVLDIRREYGYGVLTQQMLADVYGVHQGTISQIVRGVHWT